MSFSPGQQGHFRPMVADAWARELRDFPDASKCKGKRCGECDYCAWYEAELFKATGCTSSSDLDKKRDFEKAMAHFEMLVGEGIYWQMRREGGDARRVLHAMRELSSEFDADEHYMRGIARRQLKLGDDAPLPDLSELTYEQIANVRSALVRDLRVAKKSGYPAQLPTRSRECLVAPDNGPDPF